MLPTEYSTVKIPSFRMHIAGCGAGNMPQLAPFTNRLCVVITASPLPLQEDKFTCSRFEYYEQDPITKSFLIPEQTYTFMSPMEAQTAIASGEFVNKAATATSKMPASLHLALYTPCQLPANPSGVVTLANHEGFMQHVWTKTLPFKDICEGFGTHGEFTFEKVTMEDQMKYFGQMRLVGTNSENILTMKKCMTGWTTALQHEQAMALVHGHPLYSEEILVKNANEAREARVRATVEACKQLFRHENNGTAQWDLANTRNDDGMKMDMQQSNKMAMAAVAANPLPHVQMLTTA